MPGPCQILWLYCKLVCKDMQWIQWIKMCIPHALASAISRSLNLNYSHSVDIDAFLNNVSVVSFWPLVSFTLCPSDYICNVILHLLRVCTIDLLQPNSVTMTNIYPKEQIRGWKTSFMDLYDFFHSQFAFNWCSVKLELYTVGRDEGVKERKGYVGVEVVRVRSWTGLFMHRGPTTITI